MQEGEEACGGAVLIGYTELDSFVKGARARVSRLVPRSSNALVAAT